VRLIDETLVAVVADVGPPFRRSPPGRRSPDPTAEPGRVGRPPAPLARRERPTLSGGGD
jgi:hypothetical protein